MISLQNVSAQVSTGKNFGASLQSASVDLPETGLVALTGKSMGALELFLAVIAGAIRPESGELVIDGRPASAMPEADWNTLRSTSISYIKRDENLLPRETAAGNIEFAQKMAGVPAMQRGKRRQEAALAAGIDDCLHTKVSKLTREQVVRLYIARSLAADHRIMLMVDPLDRLDQKASHSVLSLLAECAKDRLVVIATPDAQIMQPYADRILKLEYGVLSEDAIPGHHAVALAPGETASLSPLSADAAANATANTTASVATAATQHAARKDSPAPSDVPAKQAQRSKALACALSFALKGMKTRVGRTVVLCLTGILLFAVVALIISFRTGAMDFIEIAQKNTLIQYPVTASNGVLATLSTSVSSSSDSNSSDSSSNSSSGTTSTTITTADNDSSDSSATEKNENLAKLKSAIESGSTAIPNYTQAIEYDYDFSPMIYLSDTSKGIYQANPCSLITLLYGLSTSNQQGTSTFDTTQAFNELPTCSSLYEDKFDVVAGTWPQSATDVVVVLDSDGKMDNYLSYLLGINDYDSLVASLDKDLNGEDVTLPTGASEYDPATLMGRTFKLVMKSDCYVKDESTSIWRNRTYNEQFMKNLVDEGTTLTVCGVMKPKSNMKNTGDYVGICYSSDLQDYVSSYNRNSAIVQEQLAHPTTNVLTGKAFASETADADADAEENVEESTQSAISALAWLLNVDESALDPDSIDVDALMNSEEVRNFLAVVSSFDPDSIDTSSFNMDDLPLPDLEKVLTLSEVEKVEVHPEVISEVLYAELTAYLDAYLAAGSAGKTAPTFAEFWETAQSQKILKRLETDLVDTSKISKKSQQKVESYLESYLSDELAPYLIDKAAACATAVLTPISNHVSDVIVPYLEKRVEVLTNEITGTMATQLSEELGFDVSSLADENSTIGLKSYFIRGLLNTLSDPQGQSCEENVANFGVVDKSKPTEINFYANSSLEKSSITDELAKYNQQKIDEGTPELKVSYLDMTSTAVDIAVSVISSTANILLLLLVVFFLFGVVSIHLSIRAVTFESRRQVSLLRCLGGGKRHVFAMFLLEAMLDGLVFSAIGVVLGIAVCGFLADAIQDGTGLELAVYLTWYVALFLVVVGVAMGVIGALGPALKASRKDISEYAF